MNPSAPSVDIQRRPYETPSIVGHAGNTALELRKSGSVYIVVTRGGSGTQTRRFANWRHAALSYAMLFHTEKCLAQLGEQI